MKFGLMFLNSWHESKSHADVYRETLEQVQKAEDLGFDSVWFAEHHFSRYGLVPSILTFASHVAAITKRVRIGTAVSILPFWHPITVAEEAAMVDVLSGGRLDLGVGRGYQWNEFYGLGIDMNESRERFEESLEIIRKAWTEEWLHHADGRIWKPDGVQVLPKPLQQPHPPLYIAGVSPDTLTRIAQMGLPRQSPATKTWRQLQKDHEMWVEALAAAGRQPGDLDVVQMRLVHVSLDGDSALRQATEEPLKWFYDVQQSVARPPQWEDLPAQYDYYRKAFPKTVKVDWDYARENIAIFGNPDHVIERIQWLEREAGASHIMCMMNFGGMDRAKILESMELFAKHVIPAFSDSVAGTQVAD